MLITVMASDDQQKILTGKTFAEGHRFHWLKDIADIGKAPADFYIDLQFVPDAARIKLLEQLLPAPVIINCVIKTLHAIRLPFIRINGWNGFLNRPVTEVALKDQLQVEEAHRVFQALKWDIAIVPDIPGMIAARIIAMIINEAYFAMEDGVSSRHEIDTAMKLGTNYPYGPFEWAEIIGLPNIAELLCTLSETDPRYQPAASLLQEADVAGAFGRGIKI